MNEVRGKPTPDAGTKWGAIRSSWFRVVVVLGALAATAVALGAGHKWF